jgi:radical SAM protein with 4Fe4S-binding SPASM domain
MTMYQKSESLSRLSSKGINLQNVLKRIHAVAKRVSPDQRFGHIVHLACEDLLDSESELDEPRPKFHLRQHVIEEIEEISDADLPRYLFYRYRYEIFPQTFQVDTFPPCLQIEPASICNYRCVFCYQTDTKLTSTGNGHMGMMELDLFKKVIDQAEGSVEAITLASRGEPLIHKKIEEMLAYLRDKFLALKINTNAWFLDERKSHAILQAGVNTLVFSADAAEEPLYSQLRVNGKLDRVLKNIEQFQHIRANQYPDSNIITRVSGVKYSEEQNFESMEGLWPDLVDQVAFVDYVPWENVYQQPINEIEQPCSDLFRRMFVWWDGRVNPCDVDYLSTLVSGNINNETLSDIWTGDGYNNLRENHMQVNRCGVAPCNRCRVI